MAELKCKDGTVIKISDETEAELRKVFGPKPSYSDHVVKVSIGNSVRYPIKICDVTRDVVDVEAYIEALQKAVEYCKLFGLGL